MQSLKKNVSPAVAAFVFIPKKILPPFLASSFPFSQAQYKLASLLTLSKQEPTPELLELEMMIWLLPLRERRARVCLADSPDWYRQHFPRYLIHCRFRRSHPSSCTLTSALRPALWSSCSLWPRQGLWAEIDRR